MHPIQAIILGIVEGATEFLPISSTGHLILASSLLHIPDSAFLKSFEIAIQVGAILAVFVMYWRSFFNIEMLKRLFVAFLPTAIIGLTLYPLVKGYLLGNQLVVVSTLFIGGIILIAFELLYKPHDTGLEPVGAPLLSYKQAVAIGFFQAIAIIPGVSRSGATIVGGMLVGIRRATIVEFSFLLAVPTLGAATALDLLKSYKTIPVSGFSTILLGAAVAFVVALIAIRFFIKYVKKHTFIPFGVYRIIIALAFFFLVIR